MCGFGDVLDIRGLWGDFAMCGKSLQGATLGIIASVQGVEAMCGALRCAMAADSWSVELLNRLRWRRR